jgi:hypothetical protein
VFECSIRDFSGAQNVDGPRVLLVFFGLECVLKWGVYASCFVSGPVFDFVSGFVSGSVFVPAFGGVSASFSVSGFAFDFLVAR